DLSKTICNYKIFHVGIVRNFVAFQPFFKFGTVSPMKTHIVLGRKRTNHFTVDFLCQSTSKRRLAGPVRAFYNHNRHPVPSRSPVQGLLRQKARYSSARFNICGIIGTLLFSKTLPCSALLISSDFAPHMGK